MVLNANFMSYVSVSGFLGIIYFVPVGVSVITGVGVIVGKVGVAWGVCLAGSIVGIGVGVSYIAVNVAVILNGVDVH